MTSIPTRCPRTRGRLLAASLVVLAVCVGGLVAAPCAAQLPASNDPLDWPNWPGPQQTSSSLEKGLPDEWNPRGGDGSNLIRKITYLGTRSTPIVMNGKLYVLVRDKPGTEHEGEKVVCVDAATGEHLWEHRFNVYLTDTPDTRVAWSNVVGDPTTGRVYAQGVCGYFCCLEGDSGKLVWDHSLHEEYGFITTYGGRTTTPVVFEDQVLVNCVEVGWGDTPQYDNLARPAHRFLAFDKATGEFRWLSSTNISPPDTTYSTPTIAVIDGEAQLIFGAADGQVWSIQPRTGKPLWHYPLSMHGLNVSPLVVGDMVYMAHGWENMVGTTKGGVVAIDAKQRGDLTGKEKWFTPHILASKSAPVLIDGQIWVVDDTAKLFRLNPDTGEQIGKRVPLGSRMAGSPLVADGKAYIATEAGIVHILAPDGEKVKKLHDVRLNREEINGSPIVSHGRIYLPTSDAIYCIGLKDVEPSAAEAPKPEPEISVGKDSEPAWVQVAPFDILVPPGASHQFTARLYNSHGQLVRAATREEAAFRVEGPGKIAPDGTYTAPANEGNVGALVYCKVGQLEGKARVRIVPPLPWTFNFNEGEIPITWIGGRVRYVLKEIDGDRAAYKLDVLPTPRDPNNKLGTRSAMYMGGADMSGYTIQADVRLADNDGRPPDVVGVINSGYTLGIRPGAKLLSIYSWASHDYRTQASIDFEPKVGVWYRLKLRVDQEDGKALVRGKYWLRDQAEPEAWSLEMTDTEPQKSGSPGVFGNAQTAPFYLDNLSVVAND